LVEKGGEGTKQPFLRASKVEVGERVLLARVATIRRGYLRIAGEAVTQMYDTPWQFDLELLEDLWNGFFRRCPYDRL
jgi:hypothetical protein